MCFRNGATETVARRKFPQGNPVKLRILTTLLLVLSAAFTAFLAGCSGGSNSGTPGTLPTPTPTPTPTPAPAVTVKASIYWGARSRAYSATSSGFATGPSSALSAVITLKSTVGGPTLTYTANRSTTNLAAYTDTYTLGTSFAGQSYALHVDFYAQPGAAGSLVATADSIVGGASVTSTGTLAVLVTTTGRIQSVKVSGVGTATAPLATLNVGQAANVIYTAYDGANGTGNIVAVTPGSEIVTVAAGVTALSVVANDAIQGVSPAAAANVIVTVDSVASDPFPIKVASVGVSIAVAATLPSSAFGTPTSPIASPGFPLVFTATVKGDPTKSGVTFALSSSGLGTLGSIVTVPDPANPTTQTLTTVTYTPPASGVPNGTQVTLTATSNYDPNLTSATTITIQSLVNVSVSYTKDGVTKTVAEGDTVPVSINTSQQFTATVNFIPTGADSTVTYSATRGTIDQTGLYTAPSTAGSDTITVTSNFDSSQKRTFNINVQAGTLPITVN